MDMRLFLLVFLAAASAFAQRFQSDCYAIQAERWTNWDFPALIKPYMPIPPEQKDGVHLFIKAQCAKSPATIRVYIRYTTAEGVKRMFTDVALLSRHEETGAVGGYLVAVVGRGVTVRDVYIEPLWPSDLVEVEASLTPSGKYDIGSSALRRVYVGGCPPGQQLQPLKGEPNWKECK
jgi:hypothetical protein